MPMLRPVAIVAGAGVLGAGGFLLARAMRRKAPPIAKAFTIERSAADVYAAWHDPQNVAAIISAPDRVEIVEDEPDRKVAWRSAGRRRALAGSATFTRAPGNRGTELRVTLESPRGCANGALAAQVESDLRRFKAKLEAGDIPLNGTDVTR